ncbi:MAG: hypothetical protein LBQ93_11715 [Treponema sp.]|jgi:hypothetical protein|nr:hypothetical protein [Treponema sp.]
MKLSSLLIFLLFISCNANKSEISTENINGNDAAILKIPAENFAGNNVKIFIPTQWINNILIFYHNKSSNFFMFPDNLANEFADIISSYNLIDEWVTQWVLLSDLDQRPWYINPMIANIDEGPDPEIIAIFGLPLQVYQVLLVFKKIENNWYLLYYEPFNMFYERPELHIANNYGPNKAFFRRRLHNRGSGLFRDAYNFYKLIDGRVYPCLGLLNEVRVYGWGVILNQDINTDFKFNDSGSDELLVTYNYHFFLSLVDEYPPWKPSDLYDISFFRGKSSIKYIWDNIEKIYKPYYDNHGLDSLTEEKIRCFLSIGDDELFIKAFDYEINKALENSTDEEKKILRWYIDSQKINN